MKASQTRPLIANPTTARINQIVSRRITKIIMPGSVRRTYANGSADHSVLRGEYWNALSRTDLPKPTAD
ncbi:MAG: hypothetical protein QOH55_940 [Microbacteriaceae bacterium]|nr:hypothetical protein [Microbacteriaceae bacterium]